MSRKAHKVDPERTREANFADRRSYVTLFGKEYRFGQDMRRIREEVHARDGGRCVECGKPQSLFEMHLDHFRVTRGRGGDDSRGNLRTLCAKCHMASHVQVRFG